MEPILVGLVANVAYDALTKAGSLPFTTSVEDRVRNAAEKVADERAALSAGDLLTVMQTDAVGKHVTEFESEGKPLSVEELATVFRDHPVTTYLDDDAEVVVKEFISAIEQELAAEPELWRQLALQYVKAERGDIEALQAGFESLQQDVTELVGLLEPEPAKEAIGTLSAQGFEWLTDVEFEDGRRNPDYCWRRSFTLAEIRAGYAIERQRQIEDRPSVSDELVSLLEDGGGAAVLGAPGAGKTTVCRTVLSRWDDHEETGPVLYRRRGGNQPITESNALADAIETAKEDGPVLVAVEDAARRGSLPVYELVHEYESDPDVSFLLNSREHEWEDFDEQARGETIDTESQLGQDVLAARTEYLDQVWVPALDEREVERIIEQFENVTDREVTIDPASLLDRIHSETGISPMLLLSYWLPVAAGQDCPNPDVDVSAFERTVYNTFEQVTKPVRESDGFGIGVESDREEELLEQVGLLVNVLNAAEVGVHTEFVLSLAEDGDERELIDQFLNELQGSLVFEPDGTRHRTHHQLWSMLYLEHHLEQADSKRTARRTFEACVNTVFEVFDDNGLREELRRYFGKETALLDAVEAQTVVFAGEIVRDIFNVGMQRPKLTPLFGTTEFSGIELPDACPPKTPVKCAFIRAEMCRSGGDSSQELTEIEAGQEIAKAKDVDTYWFEFIYATQRGHHARYQSEFGTARRYYKQSQDLACEQKSRPDEAKSLGNLGVVAKLQSNYDIAREYFNRSLNIQQDIGDHLGEAKSLGNLGAVAQSKSDYDTAREYVRQSLDIQQDIGYRVGVANSLGNLGVIARNEGDHEPAQKYHQQSLDIQQEIGDRWGQARSLTNLGTVAQSQDNYESAEKYHHRSLNIERNIGHSSGVAKSLTNLGLIAYNEGDYESARENHQQSLDIQQDIGDREGEAMSLDNLGLVSSSQNNYKMAEEYHQRSLDIKQDIGNRAGEAASLGNIGRVAQFRGDYETAREYYRRSIAIERDIGDRVGEAKDLHNLGTVAIEQEEYKAAQEYLGQASDIFVKLGVIRDALTTLDSLATISARFGNIEKALEACETALSLIEESDLSGLDKYATEFQTHADRLRDS